MTTPGLWAVIGHGLTVAKDLAEQAVTGSDATKSAAASAVRSVIGALLEGHEGKADPKEILEEIEAIQKTLTDGFAARDAAELKSLHDRFDHEKSK